MILQLIKIIKNSFLFKYAYKFSCIFGPNEQTNINLNLLDNSQKRVLISYISLWRKDFSKIYHAQSFHMNQMIYYFIKMGYCVDVCRLDDMYAYEQLKNNKYDIIIGFGSVYNKFLNEHDVPLKICFITENNPEVVNKKYQERLEYFSERHSNIDSSKSIARKGYYDITQFKKSDYCILMSSNYNAESFKSYAENIFLINANAIYNTNIAFNEVEFKNSISTSYNNYLWFGSLGLIHKGLDILIDVFNEYPDLNLNCYGIDRREKYIFKSIPKGRNVIDCGSVNVLDEKYYKDIVLKHNFVILPSCSEGMSTAVATCMAHGLIPIITKECGFESKPFIIELDGFRVEDIRKVIQNTQKMSNEEIFEMKKQCYEYARSNFSLKNFDNQFTNIMNNILR